MTRYMCSLILALVLFSLTALAYIFSRKKLNNRFVGKPIALYFLIFAVGTAFAALYLPQNMSEILIGEYLKKKCMLILSARFWGAVGVSIINAWQAFTLGKDFPKEVPGGLLYKAFFTLHFVLAPILTLGFIFSFFDTLKLEVKYIFGCKRDIYVFSELNAESLALAESIRGKDEQCDKMRRKSRKVQRNQKKQTKKNNNKPEYCEKSLAENEATEEERCEKLKKRRKSVLMFADVFKDNRERPFELLQAALRINALCYKKDVTLMKPGFRKRKRKVTFFFIGHNEEENLEQALKCISSYKSKGRQAGFYIFSDSPESAIVLDTVDKNIISNHEGIQERLKKTKKALKEIWGNPEADKESPHTDDKERRERLKKTKKVLKEIWGNPEADKESSSGQSETVKTSSDGSEKQLKQETAKAKKLLIRRVNINRNIVYDLLYTCPLFIGADTEKKKISILIVGSGRIGEEVAKAAIWCGQIYGYELEINILSNQAEKLKKKFYLDCPEIMKYNTNTSMQPLYNIDFINADVDSDDMVCFAEKHHDVTYIIVALGNDEDNINTAVKLRTLYQQYHFGKEKEPIENTVPVINAIVFDRERAKKVEELKDTRKTAYKIQTYGSITETYHIDLIVHSLYEKLARFTHYAYYKELHEGQDAADYAIDSFDDYEYNQHSSLAAAIHIKYKIFYAIQNQISKASIKDFICGHRDDSKGGYNHAVDLPPDHLVQLYDDKIENYRDGYQRIHDNFDDEVKKDPVQAWRTLRDRRRKPDILLELAVMEHRRWNAYMRTEGFSCVDIEYTKEMSQGKANQYYLSAGDYHAHIMARKHPVLVSWEVSADSCSPENKYIGNDKYDELDYISQCVTLLKGKIEDFKKTDIEIVSQIKLIIDEARKPQRN